MRRRKGEEKGHYEGEEGSSGPHNRNSQFLDIHTIHALLRESHD